MENVDLNESLAKAIQDKDIRKAKELIEQGADVDIGDKVYGFTTLM